MANTISGRRRSIAPSLIRDFYDAFTEHRMVSISDQGNLRIRKAVERILPLVRPHDAVLEIGCGTGIVTERIAQAATSGSVWVCDISEVAVSHASERVTAPNVQFHVCDVVGSFDRLALWITRPITLLVMVDVIEHIPLEEHLLLFKNLRTIMDDEAVCVITTPSPQYQRYLRENWPDELQIIDEEITISHVFNVASRAKFFVKHFSLEDVWLRNQYMHFVLSTRDALGPAIETEDSHKWMADVHLATQELTDIISTEHQFILVDESQLGSVHLARQCAIPFLERGGQYWGPPPDDETAIRELKRLHQSGATHIVFAWPAFWWLDYYQGFRQHLEATYPRVLVNHRLIAFELRNDVSRDRKP